METKRLILRSYRKSDAMDIWAHINNLQVSKYLIPVPYPYSLKDARAFIQSAIKRGRKKPQTTYHFGITLKPKGKVIGGIGVHEVDRFNGTATIGYWLGQTYWRNGYMTEALERVLGFGFKTLKLRRIHISAFTENKASNALIRKVGFGYEGQMKRHVRDKATGKIHDLNFYGMMREDFLKRRPRQRPRVLSGKVR